MPFYKVDFVYATKTEEHYRILLENTTQFECPVVCDVVHFELMHWLIFDVVYKY